jgi:glycosyltransferase involved in cell wall biosynthesis
MSTTGEPQVSVVIPAFDAERYLAEALTSVLGQTRPPAEVVVVDDGSTDGTAAVAAGFGSPVRCVSRTRGGIGAALNTGLEHTSGKLLAFLDADDVWLPDKLALQTGALSADDDLDFVFGHVRQFRSPDLTREEAARIAVRPGVSPGLAKGTMLVRRTALVRAGRFATQWTAGDFVDWYARAIDAGLRGAMLPDVVLERRLHRANNGVRDPHARQDYARVLRTVLERRGITGT